MSEWSSAFSNNSWSIFLTRYGCLNILIYLVYVQVALHCCGMKYSNSLRYLERGNHVCILKRMSIDMVLLLPSFGSHLQYPRPFVPSDDVYLRLLIYKWRMRRRQLSHFNLINMKIFGILCWTQDVFCVTLRSILCTMTTQCGSVCSSKDQVCLKQI